MRNQRLKEMSLERQRKEKVKLDKNLKLMIKHLPKAAQACRLEQLMTTHFLAEKPSYYKIKSHIENNE